MMQVIITSQPDMLVTLDEAKVALGESGTDRDGLIEGLIWAAQSELDGPKGWVGISVAQQSVEVRFDSFDCPPVRLPGGPIIGDVAITYLDSASATVVLDPETYVVLADGSLSLAAGALWPTLADQAGGCIAAYDVGIVFGEDDARLNQMKTAIIMHVRMTLDMVDADKVRKAIEALVRSMWVPVI